MSADDNNGNDDQQYNVFKRKIAMVCASNQNRSMQAHFILLKHGYTNALVYSVNNNHKNTV
jgi:rhodanese-related sulfurtransferase